MNCYFYRFSKVKWLLLKDFFIHGGHCQHCVHIESLADAQKYHLAKGDRLLFWGKKQDEALLAWAREQAVDIRFVEDGFIRSLGLGSALSPPLSLVLDASGLYFDPNQPSDLEQLLANHVFSDEQLLQGSLLVEQIKTLRISKYNHLSHQHNLTITAAPNQKVILVPGQVDDDMSVKFGAFGLNNLSLLQKVREKCPGDYIIYKPHPDVLSRNRIGDLEDDLVMQYANQIIKNASIDSVLGLVEEVHTMTSLVGFDALIRGKRVVTYGLPFYAGWGMTEDVHVSNRRGRQLSLNELVAACLLLYPHYVNPVTQKASSAFEILAYLAKEKSELDTSMTKRLSLLLKGYCLPRLRNLVKVFVKG